MELLRQQNNLIVSENDIITESRPFIEANTKKVSLSHLKQDCTIPVFSKDNECTIAHHEFIDITDKCVRSIFSGQRILQPELRTSHVVKGRVPEAIGKPVKELREEDKTIYYERMMFKIDIPSITESIGSNKLSLTVGGVRAYNQENLYSKKSFERFKLFIGFKNLVCTNLCVSSDGFVDELRVAGTNELESQILDIIGRYEIQNHIHLLKSFASLSLSEKQFAKFIGKCRLYNYLPKKQKGLVPELMLNDAQINSVAKGYYWDEHFARKDDGSISLWNLYNLLTEANKSSYIDTFLARSLNAQELIHKLSISLDSGKPNWYLH